MSAIVRTETILGFPIYNTNGTIEILTRPNEDGPYHEYLGTRVLSPGSEKPVLLLEQFRRLPRGEDDLQYVEWEKLPVGSVGVIQRRRSNPEARRLQVQIPTT